MKEKIQIAEDIKIAKTLPSAFYRSEKLFSEVQNHIFEKSWQFVCSTSELPKDSGYFPFEFIQNLIPEPLLFSRDKLGALFCLSNVCTHRGNLLAYEPGSGNLIRCRYHGRCFRMDGRFRSMPGFEGVENFPDDSDHLTNVPFGELGGLLYAALRPEVPFKDWIRPVRERLYWLPMDTLIPVPEADQDFDVSANWALYCDNFLEGFHIPYVHPALNAAIEIENYEVNLFETGSLQIGFAKEGEPCFDSPKGSPDYGKRVYAYYFWLFPNLMLNFYPWGLSLNQVIPLSVDKCRIRYRTFRFSGMPFNRTLHAIEQTELEDQLVVEATQRGIQSRFYNRGRYSPKHEQAVHHFHRLLVARLNAATMPENEQ
ncbi:MAG: aromatic ring-hydroxylating dioxygenase subunit alpha [Saprospiraceae bacterium]|nr:aromatic ring-hydroxylating dioxygenase subunit alpha [Saprospiraceae bacterium]